jgi:hypothetical protein
MRMPAFPFETTAWSEVETTRHGGTEGFALWRTRQFGDIRVRMVEYSLGYLSDHWCYKGHVLLCLEGQPQTLLADGTAVKLGPGQSYQVGDNAMAHRSSTQVGEKLFIVD